MLYESDYEACTTKIGIHRTKYIFQVNHIDVLEDVAWKGARILGYRGKREGIITTELMEGPLPEDGPSI